VVSNQYLFDDPVEFAYIANNYHFIDDAQLITASAGASYKWENTFVSLDGIFGSGLQDGFQQPYTQFNFVVSRDFNVWPDAIWPSAKPLNVRFTVVNLLDTLYQLRSGTGIGEFAPQHAAASTSPFRRSCEFTVAFLDPCRSLPAPKQARRFK
jgi:hypothetical protein